MNDVLRVAGESRVTPALPRPRRPFVYSYEAWGHSLRRLHAEGVNEGEIEVDRLSAAKSRSPASARSVRRRPFADLCKAEVERPTSRARKTSLRVTREFHELRYGSRRSASFAQISDTDRSGLNERSESYRRRRKSVTASKARSTTSSTGMLRTSP